MRYKVFDVEILRTIESVGGWDATDKMGMCCAVVYDSQYNTFRIYGDGEELRLIDDLGDCDICVGFNHINFDWRVIQRIPKSIDPGSTPAFIKVPQYDVMIEFKKAAGVNKFAKGYTLDAISNTNLGRKKTLGGSLAPIEWENGNHIRVINYCINDVVLTRDLFEMILRKAMFQDPINGRSFYLPEPKELFQNFVEKP